jgi:hypothetical protein
MKRYHEDDFNCDMHLNSPLTRTATSALEWGLENVEFAGVDIGMTDYLAEMDSLVNRAVKYTRLRRSDADIIAKLNKYIDIYNEDADGFEITLAMVMAKAFPEKEDDEPEAKVKVKKAPKKAKTKAKPAKAKPEPKPEPETGTDDEQEEDDLDFLDD